MGHGPSLLHRLTASAHRLDAAELRSHVDELDCMPMETVRHGDPVTVTGRIRAVVYTPTVHVPTLEAELYDGSGSMTLVWLGRRRIAGIEPGRRLVATGRVGFYNGRPAIYNPKYELQCAA